MIALKCQNWRARGGGGWTNPYVTDGLVAMWDGEWNVGGGVHDATATVWKDLAGNIDLNVVSTPIWGADHITMEGSGNGWVSLEIIDPYIPNILNGIGGTIEVVTRAIPTNSQNRIVTSSRIEHLTIRQIAPDQTRMGFGAKCGGVQVAQTYGNRPTDSSATLVMHDGVWSLTHHAGGREYSDSRGSVTYPITNNQKVSVGLRIDNRGDSYYIGDICHVRYYDRALTAAEIAANYAVDAARFNLA